MSIAKCPSSSIVFIRMSLVRNYYYWCIVESHFRLLKSSDHEINYTISAFTEASVRRSKAENQKHGTLRALGNEITEIKRLCPFDHVPSITEQWTLINKKKKIIDANKHKNVFRGIVSMAMIQSGSVISFSHAYRFSSVVPFVYMVLFLFFSVAAAVAAAVVISLSP